MTPDAAATNILNYGAIGSMLVLTMFAVMRLAKVFKATTEAHTAKIIEITAAHAKVIEDKDIKHDEQITKLFADFTKERKETAAIHREEMARMISAVDANTKALSDFCRNVALAGGKCGVLSSWAMKPTYNVVIVVKNGLSMKNLMRVIARFAGRLTRLKAMLVLSLINNGKD